jgi:hypothetical protein
MLTGVAAMDALRSLAATLVSKSTAKKIELTPGFGCKSNAQSRSR